jgi:hypothetical protein
MDLWLNFGWQTKPRRKGAAWGDDGWMIKAE